MTIHHHLPGKKPEATLPGIPESPVQQLAVDLVTWQFRFVVQTWGNQFTIENPNLQSLTGAC